MNTRHHYLSLLRTFALATLTAAVVAACTDDNGDPAGSEPITPADGIPVTFSANINPGSDAAPDTRTILTPDNGGFTVTWKGANDNPSDCDAILIWAAQGTTTIGFKTYVPTTSEASSVLEPEDDGNKLTLTETGEWKFTAVYGANLNSYSGPAARLSPLTQSRPGNTEHIAKKDFSVATVTKTVAASDMPANISFKFHHLLSALQLQVKNGTGEALTVKEIRLSVRENKIDYLRDYNVATGGWGADDNCDYLELTADNFPPLATGGASQNLHMLLFPGYENKTLTITVITDRGDYILTKGAPAGGFIAGKNYLTDITIRTDGLTDEEKWVEYISNKAELIAFRDKVNNGNTYDGKTVRLTADIDLANETWTTPIGTDGSKPFSGTFDGGGYLISKLSVDYGSNNNAGLFGYVVGGTVRNLRVSGTVKTTGNNAGGIAGTLNGSTVENCIFDGNVSAGSRSGSNAGGIAGYLNGSTVENCIFDGDVSAGSRAGGIAGNDDNNSRIAGCHTKGKVTARLTVHAGGIAGLNEGSTIDGCYSEAEVTAYIGNAGGIAGGNNSGGTITYCYATGKVSGKSIIGGIVGNQYNGTITGCIALNPGLTRTGDSETDFGRVVGKSHGTSTVTSCAAFDGMTIKDATSNTDIIGTTGVAGDDLTAAACLIKDTYTGFAEPTATKPGWAFDAASPWGYLPWNPAFASFSGISEANYKISASTLTGGGSN